MMTILLVTIFAIVNDNFLTLSNLQNIIEQNAALAIVAVGVTFGIIATMIDLSPGSAIALSGVSMGLTYQATNNTSLTILAGLATTILIGLFNGSLVAFTQINSVIVTLACMIWARGLALALTEKASIVIRSPLVGFMNSRFFDLISPQMVLVLLAYIFGYIVLNKTRLGRYTYALGGDETATREAGVRTRRYKVGIFLISGFLVVGEDGYEGVSRNTVADDVEGAGGGGGTDADEAGAGNDQVSSVVSVGVESQVVTVVVVEEDGLGSTGFIVKADFRIVFGLEFESRVTDAAGGGVGDGEGNSIVKACA